MTDYWTAPRYWEEETAYILAGGPGLDLIDLERLKGANVIAINFSFLKAPWADVVYGTDENFWVAMVDDVGTSALKVTVAPGAPKGVLKLRNTGLCGLEEEPTGLRIGWTSTYAAINLAVHFGANKIVLMGVDMRLVDGCTHWSGYPQVDVRMKSDPDFCRRYLMPNFDSLVAPLAAREIEVLNATPGSGLTCFPMVAPETIY